MPAVRAVECLAAGWAWTPVDHRYSPLIVACAQWYYEMCLSPDVSFTDDDRYA